MGLLYEAISSRDYANREVMKKTNTTHDHLKLKLRIYLDSLFAQRNMRNSISTNHMTDSKKPRYNNDILHPMAGAEHALIRRQNKKI